VTGDRLYNLAQDVGESHDLAGENPQNVQGIRAAWRARDKELARRRGGRGARESLPSDRPSSNDHIAAWPWVDERS
jgi:hypothetical protein